MNDQRLLSDVNSINLLAERLSRCPEVTKLDDTDHKEAWVIAHAFSDLEESFGVFLRDQLPKLTDGSLEGEELFDLLLEVGEEFRHILYHLRDPRFYEYLNET